MSYNDAPDERREGETDEEQLNEVQKNEKSVELELVDKGGVDIGQKPHFCGASHGLSQALNSRNAKHL